MVFTHFGRRRRLPGPGGRRVTRRIALSFLVALEVAIDKAGHVVVFFLFLGEESVVDVGFVLEFDVLIDLNGVNLALHAFGLIERHGFRPLFFEFSVIFDRDGHGARQWRDVEDRAALGTNDRVLVQVVKLGRARLTLALGAESGFATVLLSSKMKQRETPA